MFCTEQTGKNLKKSEICDFVNSGWDHEIDPCSSFIVLDKLKNCSASGPCAAIVNRLAQLGIPLWDEQD